MSKIGVKKSSKLEKSLLLPCHCCMQESSRLQNCQMTVTKSLEFFLRKFR